jgi:hypothetical protein
MSPGRRINAHKNLLEMMSDASVWGPSTSSIASIVRLYLARVFGSEEERWEADVRAATELEGTELYVEGSLIPSVRVFESK